MIRPDIVARLVGREGQPLAIIDGFAPAPETLRADAAAGCFTPAVAHYPGVRAPLPSGYFEAGQAILATVLREVFGHRRNVQVLDASFSIVTTPPSALSVQQRLPHVDAVEPGRIALVHYLSPEGGDGTAFYRHRATGFETIDEARATVFYDRLAGELRDTGPPPAAYIAGDTPLFERTALVEARYNRAVLYRSAMLHSGAIGPGAALAPDPLTGRLTITAFLSAT